MKSVLLLLASLVCAQAAVHYPASLSLPVVQAALDGASDGDTVVLPPGTDTWSSFLNISGKALRIMGSGTNPADIQLVTNASGYVYYSGSIYGGGTNATVIVNGVGSQIRTPLIKVHNLGAKSFWLSHIVLDGANGAQPNDGLLWVGDMANPGPSTIHSNVNWGISNLSISNFVKGGIWDRAGVGGHYGIYWNIGFFVTSGTPNSATGLRAYGYTNAFAHGPLWGTTNKTWIEDSLFMFLFSGNGAWDSYRGAMLGMRHCVVYNCVLGAHGTDSGGIALRGGAHSLEINNNQIYSLEATETLSAKRIFQYRGGTFLIHDNVINVHPTAKMTVHCDHYRAFSTNIPYAKGFPTNLYDPWDFVTGLSNNMATVHPEWVPYNPTPNPKDGNQDIYGYPALDQIGISGPYTYGPTNWLGTSSPAYVWSNSINGIDLLCQVNVETNDWGGPVGTNLIQRGRDFFDDGTTPPGYTPLSYPHPKRLALIGASAPTISEIASVTAAIGTVTNLTFTVSAGDLTYDVSSSDEAVLPPAGIVLGGSGTSRTADITTSSVGTSIVTIRVTDGNFLSAVESFTVTSVVGPVETAISTIADQTIVHDTSTGPLAFTIANGSMVLSKLSLQQDIVPNSGIVFSGSGTERFVEVTPAAGISGVARINVGVDIAGQTNYTTFLVTVTPDRTAGPKRVD